MKGSDFCGCELALISKRGNVIANRTLTANNLIKFCFHYAKQLSPPSITSYPPISQSERSWDVWHCCFGHVGFSGLQRTLDLQLVMGFNMDCDSPKSDCAACPEAKQSVLPFNKKGDNDTHPGDLTHINVWGKYDVALINSCQLSPLAPGSSWTDWSHAWGREVYLKRALEKLNLEYPRDSDD